jgi:formate hydrogenlyase transcriptional activator
MVTAPLPSSEARLREERDRLSLLLEVTNVLVSRHALPDLLQALSERIQKVIPHEGALVNLFEPPGKLVRAPVRLAMLDGVRQSAFEGFTFSLTDPVIGPLSRGEAMTYELEMIRFNNPPIYEALKPGGLQSFCSTPLVTARGYVGMLTVGSRRPDAFDAADVQLMREVSGQIAVAVENALNFEEIRRLRDELLSEKEYLEEEIREQHDFRDIVGQSGSLRRALQQVDTVASTDATVLLMGETGTGKELVARAIHERSARRSHTFVKVNCAAIPATLIESEMFGHERGAFTGAVAARPGRFEMAHRGTLFLDEVGDLPMEVQPKLLRALQEREIERLGGTTVIPVDVRLIAATNRDLAAMVGADEFRDDLFYRLNVFPIRLPPLRERRDDIPALVRHFVARHAQRLKRPIAEIPAETMAALCQWDWPGNIRELQNVLERATILATDGVLRAPFLGLPATPVAAPVEAGTLNRLEDVERAAILDALRATHGIVGGPAGAAAKLGLRRTTLQSRMQKLGLRRGGYG